MTDIVETLRDGCDCGSAKAECPAKEACQDAFDAADEIERLRETVRSLRAALERRQRPEAETIDGVIAWIKEDAERLAKTRAALGENE